MRGLKGSEIVGIVGCGAASFGMVGVSFWQLYAGLSALASEGTAARTPSFLIFNALALYIAYQVGDAGYVKLRLSRIRRGVTEHPEGFFAGRPYEGLMPRDDDLMELARKVGELSQAYSSDDWRWRRFMVEYEKTLNEYQPGSSWSSREIQRLGEAAERGFEDRTPFDAAARDGEPEVREVEGASAGVRLAIFAVSCGLIAMLMGPIVIELVAKIAGMLQGGS